MWTAGRTKVSPGASIPVDEKGYAPFRARKRLRIWEGELRAKRTAAGREAARARGRSDGRPKIDQEKVKHAQSLFAAGYKTVDWGICTVRISRREAVETNL